MLLLDRGGQSGAARDGGLLGADAEGAGSVLAGYVPGSIPVQVRVLALHVSHDLALISLQHRLSHHISAGKYSGARAILGASSDSGVSWL